MAHTLPHTNKEEKKNMARTAVTNNVPNRVHEATLHPKDYIHERGVPTQNNPPKQMQRLSLDLIAINAATHKHERKKNAARTPMANNVTKHAQKTTLDRKYTIQKCAMPT
jgi:hypothetical protein